MSVANLTLPLTSTLRFYAARGGRMTSPRSFGYSLRSPTLQFFFRPDVAVMS